ncbi:hypothetical protein [Nitrosomonas sp. sh817]|uniref:hypothetical protein n=1 Tax=Nitrosomonas sp. sh817 TaxID=3070658 RepID=UPI0027DD9C62|nr:hypothetical protein [Nitrosomonas sp. sh817]WMJ09210.1 hypothetical protein RBH92_03170 [Nitrosomonas sp. sh817]
MRDGYNDESLVIEDCSLPGCTELNPWLPIDENMPTNKHIFIHANDTAQIGMFDGITDGPSENSKNWSRLAISEKSLFY